MTPATPQFTDYVLPRLRNVAPIDHLVYDDLGKEVLRIHNERFQGINHIEDRADYKPNQYISFSNTPRILSYHQILHQLTGGKIGIASFADVVRYWKDIPEKSATYADLNGIVLFPKEGPNEDFRHKVLSLLEKKSLEVPLLVAGLGVERASNDHGFTPTRTELTHARDAPYLTDHVKVRYDEAKREVVAALEDEDGVRVIVPNDQAGLRVLVRDGTSNLNARDWNLVNSYVDGRVEIVQKYPKGCA